MTILLTYLIIGAIYYVVLFALNPSSSGGFFEFSEWFVFLVCVILWPLSIALHIKNFLD
ncbi:hypothetical protein D3C81_931060 [compost metagenome]